MVRTQWRLGGDREKKVISSLVSIDTDFISLILWLQYHII